MKLGLAHLVEERLVEHAEDSRRYHAAREASGGQRGPSDNSELLEARARLAAQPVGEDLALQWIARAGAHEVPVRVTQPRSGMSRGVYLDIHGGGFFMDSAARRDVYNARLSNALGISVISVEHRLAPEHPWPAAPDDCETATLWLIDHSHRLFNTDRLLISRQSSGATLTAATLLRLRDRGFDDAFAAAVLLFGAYDLSGLSPGGRRYADEWFIEAYAGHAMDRTNPDISPLYGDLHGLPPTLLVVGTLDVLLDDNLAMAARLSAAGNDVDLRVYPDAMHGFTAHPTSLAAVAIDDTEKWLRQFL